MAVRRRSAVFRACLAKDFVTTIPGAWCKNRDLLADDIKRAGLVAGVKTNASGMEVLL
jgi:hypothetical protein